MLVLSHIVPYTLKTSEIPHLLDNAGLWADSGVTISSHSFHFFYISRANDVSIQCVDSRCFPMELRY